MIANETYHTMKKPILLLILLLTCISSGIMAQEPEEIVKYYFVELITNPDRPDLPAEQVDSIQTAHLKNINALYEEGKLMLAGPFEKGGGIFVLSVSTLSEAERIAENDPAVSAGRLLVEVRPWYTGKGVFTNESGKLP